MTERRHLTRFQVGLGKDFAVHLDEDLFDDLRLDEDGRDKEAEREGQTDNVAMEMSHS